MLTPLDILTFKHFIYGTDFFTENFDDFTIFYIYIQFDIMYWDYKSKYRCTTYNISTSNCVRATDPLY
jgi:hypothetical protein